MGFGDRFKKAFGSSENFKYLDELIHSGVKEIVLDSNIVLDKNEQSEYRDGINVDVDDFVIDGNGHGIDAGGKARIFEVTGKNITIKNITLKNGFTDDNGGAIKINHDATLTLVNCEFTNNLSERDGGAIHAFGDELKITKSVLDSNTANISGGAISGDGCELTISESLFNNNAAKDGNGGAIRNKDGQLTISESTLTNNTAQGEYGGGGAIENFDFNEGMIRTKDISARLIMTNCKLNNNTAKDGGGAIHNYDGEITIIKSSFSENSAKKDGGAIDSNGNLTIIESNLNKNSSRFGGAIQCMDLLKIKGTTFTENTAEEGGAIYQSISGPFSIIESKMSNNTSKESGGAIYNGGVLKICKSQFDKNTSNNGGAIHNHGSADVNSSSFIENIANQNGGAIINFAKMIIKDNEFISNTSKESCGGAINNQRGGTITGSKSLFKGNVAGKDGDDIFSLNDEDIRLINDKIENNEEEIIKSSGYNIRPSEVETAVLSHKAVKNCEITACPNELRGQIVKAIITLQPSYEPSDKLTKDIQHHVKSNIAPYKYPRIIEYVDEIPK